MVSLDKVTFIRLIPALLTASSAPCESRVKLTFTLVAAESSRVAARPAEFTWVKVGKSIGLQALPTPGASKIQPRRPVPLLSLTSMLNP